MKRHGLWMWVWLAPVACVGDTSDSTDSTDTTVTDTTMVDSDADGVADDVDNCVEVANPDQADGDADEVGDACDNCATVSNNQADADEDELGDACDNCPDLSNVTQDDADRDGYGDACDAREDYVSFSMETHEVAEDCVTKDVCLTRGSGGSLYNSVTESSYDGGNRAALYAGKVERKGGSGSGSPEGARIKVGYAGLDAAWGGMAEIHGNLDFTGPMVSLQPFTLRVEDTEEEWNVLFTSWEQGSVFDTKKGGWTQTSAKTRGWGWTRAPVVSFTKADDADATLAENQDCVTRDVCLTRGSSQSVYNAAQEGSYSGTSPAGTEWAMGTTWDARTRGTTYGTFADAVDSPQKAIGHTLSLHIVGTDLYYDVVLTEFSGGGSGGGFSWKRSRALVPGCMAEDGDNYDPVATADIGYCDAEWTVFYRPPGVDPEEARYQDCLSKDLCITRASTAGLFNAVVEKSFDSKGPTGTLWGPVATADAEVDWYDSWANTHGWYPSYALHRTFSVYDIEDDTYHDVVTLRWQNADGNPDSDLTGTGAFAWARRSVKDRPIKVDR